MSFYNMVCGNNPLFGAFARVLETVAPLPPVPRFRDMYTREANGQVQVVLYTRTGGGNRGDYAAENKALTEHPLYLCDFDDSFDRTFAHFVYSVPEEFQYELLILHREFSQFQKGKSPREKFDIFMGHTEHVDPEDVSACADALAQFTHILPQGLSSLEEALLPHSKITVLHPGDHDNDDTVLEDA